MRLLVDTWNGADILCNGRCFHRRDLASNRNYNSKREDLEEEDQERDVIIVDDQKDAKFFVMTSPIYREKTISIKKKPF